MSGQAELIGRERELAEISAGLAGDGLRLVLILGDPGIGKSSILRAAVAAASIGRLVLTARATEAERPLAFSGLSELLPDALLDVVLPRLPTPRRHAIELALARTAGTAVGIAGAEPGSATQTIDPIALGLGIASALRAMAVDAPLLIVIDDLPWLDTPTALALAFAFRRLEHEAVAIVATARRDPGDAPRAFADAVDADRSTRIDLGPLSLGSLGRLIGGRAGVTLGRGPLVRLHAMSRGNAFLALEITRAITAVGGSPGPTEPFPVPADLEALLAERLDLLSPDARDLVLVVAAVARPRIDLLRRALPGRFDDALMEAVAAEVLLREGEMIRPVHPLIASVAYGRTPPSRQRVVHRRLAVLTEDPEERARHLALGSDRPNADVARALDEAAQSARARGAPGSAAELGALAVRATPTDDEPESRRRRLAVALDLLHAGELDAARRELEALLGMLPAGGARVPALLCLSDVELARDDRAASVRWCELALADAGEDRALRGRCHAAIASASPYHVDDESRHARLAIRLLDRLEAVEPDALARALCTLADNEVWAGRGLQRSALERALAIDARARPAVLAQPAATYGSILMRVDAFEEARGHLDTALRDAVGRGDEAARMSVLVHQAGLEILTGRLGAALERLDEVRALAAECGFAIPIAAAYRAQVDALRGSLDEARSAASAGLAEVELAGDRWSIAVYARSLGIVALALGEGIEAERMFSRAIGIFADHGVVEPNAMRLHADLIEAMLLAGRADDAEPILEAFEGRARRHGFAWSMATSTRCRGLLQAARGDIPGAATTLRAALALHAGLDMPFERGRTLLALGSVERRGLQRAAARVALAEALATFEAVGTPVWAERARSELARIPGRATRESLSSSERQIAELAVGGRTNREIAAALTISVRTVEGHLARAYGKLGIERRTQLSAALAVDRGPEGQPGMS